MQTEIISVGTEILMGMVENTNASFLSRECTRLGFSVIRQVTVGDAGKSIIDAVKTASGRARLILVTGGLGPTEDDLTREAIAEAFGIRMIPDSHTKERIKKFFLSSAQSDIPENNWKQADVLENCIVLDNENGTAPGMLIKKEKVIIVLLPGPPKEMQPMFRNQVKPYLEKETAVAFYSKTVKICGLLESAVALKIKDLIENQIDFTIATYAKTGEVHIVLTASGENEQDAKNHIKPVVKELRERFGNNIYTTDENVSLEECVVQLLKKHNLSFTAAESCTGGLIASAVINVPGASDVMKQSFVTYSNKAKRKYLDVGKETLKKYTEYSEKCAEEMARGVAMNADCDVSVSVTGIAGPGGGTDEKPVGLVYIGCFANGKVTVREFHFQGTREMIRIKSKVFALDLVRRCILKYY